MCERFYGYDISPAGEMLVEVWVDESGVYHVEQPVWLTTS